MKISEQVRELEEEIKQLKADRMNALELLHLAMDIFEDDIENAEKDSDIKDWFEASLSWGDGW